MSLSPGIHTPRIKRAQQADASPARCWWKSEYKRVEGMVRTGLPSGGGQDSTLIGSPGRRMPWGTEEARAELPSDRLHLLLSLEPPCLGH